MYYNRESTTQITLGSLPRSPPKLIQLEPKAISWWTFILLQIISYITYIAYFLILLYILLRTTADEEATWPEVSISEVEVGCKSF